MNWYLKVLKQYADFSGRARRKEFWMFTLFHFIIIILFMLMAFTFNTDNYEGEETNYFAMIFVGLYFLGTIIPSIAVSVRRLHDIGKSGFWYFISFIPYIGSFWLLILMCMEGKSGINQWGENPKGIGNDSSINQIGIE